MIRVGIIGYGYWGPNLARNVHATPELQLASICDADDGRMRAAHAAYPWIAPVSSALQLIASPDIDAIAIATPVDSHFDLALAALQTGKHVLVEKPLTASSAQGAKLITEATQRRLVLMVDHPYVYAPAVQRMRSMIEADMLGRLLYYDSVRANLGRFRADVDVLWDLAVHDLSILDYLMASPAQEVSAVGASCMSDMQQGGADVAYLTVRYANGLLAHVHANWLAPVKIRRAMLGGSRSMLVFDDIEVSEKLKHYDHGVEWTAAPERDADELQQRRIGYRTGDVWSPQLPVVEPLSRVCAEFAAAIGQRRAPLTDGQCGVRVLAILEAASQSMRRHGAPTEM